MIKRFKRMLCLLLVLAASCAVLTLAVSAAEEASVQPRAATLTTPAVTKLEMTDAGIKLTWGKVTGAAQYRVYLKSGSGWTALGNTASTSYTYADAVGGKTYTFTVRCLSADGKSFTSGYNATGWTYTVYVDQPVVKKIENRATGVRLTWNPVTGAERYRIYVKTPGGSWDYVGNTMGNTFTYIWVESGQDYIFTVRCANKDNNIATSSYNKTGWQITYIGQPRVTKLESTDTGIKLTWDAITGAARYRVYVQTSSGWKIVGTTTDPEFTYTGAQDGVSYTFTVRSANEANTVLSSYYESGWHHTYEKPDLLAAPQVTGLENVSDGVKVSWDSVPGAAQYRVYVKTNGRFSCAGVTSGTEFVYKNAVSGTKYYFTVRCVNAANNAFTSDYNSSGWSVTYVAAPQVTGLENVSDGVKVSWDSGPGAAQYRVYVKTNGRFSCAGVTSGTEFVYKNAVSGTKYYFTVRCVNGANNAFTSDYNSSGWSVTYVATPQVTGLENVSDGVKVSWNSVPGAAQYRVYVKTNGHWACVGVTTGTEFVYKNAVSGTKYYFTVRCVNGANNAFTSDYNSSGWSIVCE